MKICHASLILFLMCFANTGVSQEAVQFPGQAGDWHGFAKYQVDVEGKTATVVVPKKVAPGRPWVWHGEFFGHKPAPDIELLNRGFHLVYLSIPNMLGSPSAVKHWDKCYEVMTGKYQLAPKVALVGLSRGGLYCYNWAIANPTKVACIYGDAPVCDFKSWPGGNGTGKGSEQNWKLVLELWNFKDEEEALAYKGNPVDQLSPLALAGVPLLHVFGDADDVVPWEENSGLIADRYRKLGGSIQMIRKKGVNHHPHGLEDSTPIVEFIEKHAAPPKGQAIFRENGLETYQLESEHQSAPTNLYVLKPLGAQKEKPLRIVFLLPVEAGEGSQWGSPLAEVYQQGLHEKHQIIFVTATFSDLPWYADHPDNPKLQQEQYILGSVLPFIRWNVPEGRHDRDGRLLIGFSKSGWGAWSLLLRHPDKFAKAAAWDAPLMMKAPGKYGSMPIFGSEENFEEYHLSAILKQASESNVADNRLIHAGYGNFREHHEEMDSLLKSLEIPAIYIDGPQRKHHWQSGWFPELLEELLK
ncbi:hypothetical protein [Thalassoglobus sp.]|uniref:hypothetical protein n=1 Tax=Thalassoglobus sp. TaxID=2795869 RepID=UPI003AA9DA9A